MRLSERLGRRFRIAIAHENSAATWVLFGLNGDDVNLVSNDEVRARWTISRVAFIRDFVEVS